MTPEQLERLLNLRRAVVQQIDEMAETPRIARAVARSRDGKGRGQHLKDAQSSIRLFEGIDHLLYRAAKIKKLPKPKYPGGHRV